MFYWVLGFITVLCYTERGYDTVCHLSVCLWHSENLLSKLSCKYNISSFTELSLRWTRDAPNIWASWKLPSPWVRPWLLFPKFLYDGLLFQSIPGMCVQNLKFVTLPIPEIIGGTQKISAVPGYAHAPFYPKFSMGFCSDGTCECTGQIWSLQLYPFLR